MIRKPLIIGAAGNMSSRYKAIFNKILNDWKPFDGLYQWFEGYECYDTKTNPETLTEFLNTSDCDSFLITTPTETHAGLIYALAGYGRPILCEKPIAKREDTMYSLLSFCRRERVNLHMINQYAYADLSGRVYGSFPVRDNLSMYNFFKHGTDGIAWDCINILGLAQDRCFLSEDSPIWTCSLNGRKVHYSDIDGCYVRMILGWIKNPTDNLDYIETAHNKVFNYLKENE